VVEKGVEGKLVVGKEVGRSSTEENVSEAEEIFSTVATSSFEVVSFFVVNFFAEEDFFRANVVKFRTF